MVKKSNANIKNHTYLSIMLTQLVSNTNKKRHNFTKKMFKVGNKVNSFLRVVLQHWFPSAFPFTTTEHELSLSSTGTIDTHQNKKLLKDYLGQGQVRTIENNVPQRICIVGPSTYFMSGISYYTIYLANALVGNYEVSALLLRQLAPKFLYPGREHVGLKLTALRFQSNIPTYDGLDWHWLPNLLGAIQFLYRNRPHMIIIQWWTAATFHTFLILTTIARILGSSVCFEFHELIDNTEKRFPLIQLYANLMSRVLVNLANGFIVHSEAELQVINERFKLEKTRHNVQIVPHGPYDHHNTNNCPDAKSDDDDKFNLLFFGVIRAYKGLTDLVQAFNDFTLEEVSPYKLTIVGEPWDETEKCLDMISTSAYRDRITFIDRYIPDEEVSIHFSQADAVILPYRRASSSGVLHIAMSFGLPVVVTDVGSFRESTSQYAGAIMIPPNDVEALKNGIHKAIKLRGLRFPNPHSWENSIQNISELMRKANNTARYR